MINLDAPFKNGFSIRDIIMLVMFIATIIALIYFAGVAFDAKQVCIDTCSGCKTAAIGSGPYIPVGE